MELGGGGGGGGLNILQSVVSHTHTQANTASSVSNDSVQKLVKLFLLQVTLKDFVFSRFLDSDSDSIINKLIIELPKYLAIAEDISPQTEET